MDAANAGYAYWGFVSYSSRDAKWGRWVHRKIESYGIPARLVSQPTPAGSPAPKRFRPVFRDRDELPASPDLGAKLEDALRASRYLIVVCSPHAARSAWVNREIETFLAMGRADRVFAVIVDGEPNAGDARECFPPALRGLNLVAADARRHGDGKTGARLKLLAGMLGVGFEALRLRYEQQRNRRLWIVIAGALALAAVLAAMAWYSNEQRKKAVAARNQAESILEFLVYDLQGKLKTVGRLDLLDDVQRRVRQYFLQLGVDENDPRFGYNQRVAQSNEADRLLDEGKLGAALVKYEECLSSALQQSAANPTDDVRLESVAVYHTKIGTVQRMRGDHAGALQSFRAALAILEGMAARHPHDEDTRQRIVKAWRDIGLSQHATGDAESGLASYRKSWDVLQPLLSGPSAAEYRADARGLAGEWSQMLLQSGDVAEALRTCRLAMDLAEQVELQNPRDADARAAGAAVGTQLGDILLTGGRAAEAEEVFQSSAAIMSKLAQSDPLNHDWHRDLAVDRSKIGDARLARKDYAGALEAYRAGLAVSRALVEREVSNATDQHDMEVAYGQIGFVLLVQGNLAASTEAYTQALAIGNRLAALNPDNRTWQLDLAIGHFRLGDLARRSGRGAEAESHLRQSQAIFWSVRRTGITLAPPLQKVLDELDARFGQPPG
jgi:eukaryotic-like serine/threonine-protein kinase